MADYWEFDHSPTEHYTEDGSFFAKRRLGCAWEDRYIVLNTFTGGASSLYPYSPFYVAPAVSATIVPFNDIPSLAPGTLNEWSYGTAVITVTYAVASYYPRNINGRMLIEEMHPSLEYRTLPKEKVSIGSPGSGTTPERDVRLLTPTMDYNLSVYDLAGVSNNAMALIGKMNAAAWRTYTFGGLEFPAETLWFIGPTPSTRLRLGLLPNMSISLAFKYRPASWGKDLTENGWEYMYNESGDLIVQTGDFRWLQPSWLSP